ncbi:Chaperone protein ClpD1, chloroplastic [Datura stramonium]|uniref:Chaperone protein ClpD1, chloroplastic n=1 Tax=Datura stramonium TaxID=4076 RepID=A0ABS8SHU4_DATST|nr:Chaperone protein ClpD1, chloroplastic [Datura stramonium]
MSKRFIPFSVLSFFLLMFSWLLLFVVLAVLLRPFYRISLSHVTTAPPSHANQALFVYLLLGCSRLHERSIKAVMFSQKEAKALGKDMVFTQHLLLGLIAEDRSPDGFLGSRITIDKAREAVRSIWRDDSEDDITKLGSRDSGSATSATDVAFSSSTDVILPLVCLPVDDGNAGRVLEVRANVNRLAAEAVSRLQGELAKDGGLIDPVIGRETEVQRIIEILCRRNQKYPILLGQAGVGKTAIAEGLAINIAEGNIPAFLMTPNVVGPEEIAAVASLWTGIPLKQLTVDERMLLVGLDEQLRKRVVGQDEAVTSICRAVKRSELASGPNGPFRPMLFWPGICHAKIGYEYEYMERHTVVVNWLQPPFCRLWRRRTLTRSYPKKALHCSAARQGNETIEYITLAFMFFMSDARDTKPDAGDLLSESLLSGDFKPGDVAMIHLDESGNPVVINQSSLSTHLSETNGNPVVTNQ